MRRFTLVCDESRAREIEGLAHEYDLTEREVLDQLVRLGLERVAGGNDVAGDEGERIPE
jgi:hypothetical protein